MDAHPSSVDSARSGSPATNGDDATQAAQTLFRILADGESHRSADLARILGEPPERLIRHVATLAAFGIAIDTERDAIRTTPYVLLDASSIARLLHAAKRSPAGRPWQARVVFATDSTNDDVLAEVRADPHFQGPSLRVTEVQRKGRGRLGRAWISAPGASLTASFALWIARPLAGLDGVTLACGLAVHEVLTAWGAAARLKWPNDILVEGRKLAGILVEATTARGGTLLVIGVGINLAGMDGSRGAGCLPAGVARLRAAGAPPIDRNALVAGLALSLEAQMAPFAAAGFGVFADRWNAVDAFRDLPVTLTSSWDPDVAGIARGVDDRGALLLDVGGERRRIIAGDVSLRLASQPVERPAT
ncbi:MAG: biotin--[acetyl-CoA-carboxylase] ligase [Burkholderiaceae bacterium]